MGLSDERELRGKSLCEPTFAEEEAGRSSEELRE
jgi:hypothetical protein